MCVLVLTVSLLPPVLRGKLGSCRLPASVATARVSYLTVKKTQTATFSVYVVSDRKQITFFFFKHSRRNLNCEKTDRVGLGHFPLSKKYQIFPSYSKKPNYTVSQPLEQNHNNSTQFVFRINKPLQAFYSHLLFYRFSVVNQHITDLPFPRTVIYQF